MSATLSQRTRTPPPPPPPPLYLCFISTSSRYEYWFVCQFIFFTNPMICLFLVVFHTYCSFVLEPDTTPPPHTPRYPAYLSVPTPPSANYSMYPRPGMSYEENWTLIYFPFFDTSPPSFRPSCHHYSLTCVLFYVLPLFHVFLRTLYSSFMYVLSPSLLAFLPPSILSYYL